MNTDQLLSTVAQIDGYHLRNDGRDFHGSEWTRDDQNFIPQSELFEKYGTYDGIIPVIQRQGMSHMVERTCTFNSEPIELCKALVRAAGKWTE